MSKKFKIRFNSTTATNNKYFKKFLSNEIIQLYRVISMIEDNSILLEKWRNLKALNNIYEIEKFKKLIYLINNENVYKRLVRRRKLNRINENI